MIRFGPAGNCERFYAEGHSSSEQAPAWVAQQGLNAYEYSAGHGVSISEAKARKIGVEAAKAGIAMSIHAPYYINCGNPDLEKRENNVRYLLSAAQAVTWFGGDRVVFHPGSPGKLNRANAMELAIEAIKLARARLDKSGFEHIWLCPETMGRPSQLGTLDEVLKICLETEHTLPTIDFGHLHAAKCGGMLGEADFERVICQMISALGTERSRHFHAHFSRIAFTAKGEKCHMNFSDEGFGPDYAHLAPIIKKYGLEPTIICESRGNQADDALSMQRISASLEE